MVNEIYIMDYLQVKLQSHIDHSNELFHVLLLFGHRLYTVVTLQVIMIMVFIKEEKNTLALFLA